MLWKRVLGHGVVAGLMGANAWTLVGSRERAVRVAHEPGWALKLGEVRSLVATVLTPGAAPTVVVQTPRTLALVGPDGRVTRQQDLPDVLALATGDLTGDGADDVVVLRGSPARVELRDAALEPRWTTLVERPDAPTRVLAADLDGDGRAEVLVGGPAGVDALSSQGRTQWSYRFPGETPAGEQGELRGLDDLRLARGARVAVARRDGRFAVLDASGQAAAELNLGSEVRRLRTADLDGRGPEPGCVLLGFDNGEVVLRGPQGQPLSAARLPSAVVELRTLHAEGRHGPALIGAGDKKGALQLLRGNGITVFSAAVDARVTAIGGVDLDGDGREEMVVGDEGGSVTVFSPAGERLARFAAGGRVERVLAWGARGGAQRVLVGSATGLTLHGLRTDTAPAWYSPAAAALLGLGALTALGLVWGRLRPPRPPHAGAADVTLQPVVKAQAQLEALIASGRISRTAAAERVAQLAEELARADAARADAEAGPTPETTTPSAPARRAPPPPPRRGR